MSFFGFTQPTNLSQLLIKRLFLPNLKKNIYISQQAPPYTLQMKQTSHVMLFYTLSRSSLRKQQMIYKLLLDCVCFRKCKFLFVRKACLFQYETHQRSCVRNREVLASITDRSASSGRPLNLEEGSGYTEQQRATFLTSYRYRTLYEQDMAILREGIILY